MIKKAKYLEFQWDAPANSEYLLEYQRAVLRALQQNKILTSQQMEDCILILEKQQH